MRIVTAGLLLGGFATGLFACASAQPTVSGEVTYPVETVLPVDAVLTVQIQDTSRADTAATVVGEQTIQTSGGQAPINFAVAYDPSKIDQTHNYSLAARIEDAQHKLLLINDQGIPVITRGAPSSGVQVALVPAGGLDASQKALTANPWLLTELGGNSLLSGTQITAIFSPDGKLTGSAGCNSYIAQYQDGRSQLSIGRPITTLLACGAGIMQQESDYLQALAAASGYSASTGSLTLTDADQTNLAVFAAQSLDLAGSSWVVAGYDNGKGGLVSVLPGTQMDATFGTDGNIGGSAGCNNYFAPYTVVNSTAVEIGPPVTTKVLCSNPQGIMQQETSYLLALESAATYELSGSSLTLRKGDGTTAVSLSRAP